jgi:hypothetical protein
MAKKGVSKKHRRKAPDAVPTEETVIAVTLIEAQLDVAGAVALREDLLCAMSDGAVRIELSEGKPTQPALQLLAAARNSARSGHDVSFEPVASAILNTMIEEAV